jgi:hypothetical protein
MDEEPPWAITLYVPDRLLPALNGDDAELRGTLDGVAELKFVVPRWWESAHTVRLGALKPAGGPPPQAPACDEPNGPRSTIEGVGAPAPAKPGCSISENHA